MRVDEKDPDIRKDCEMSGLDLDLSLCAVLVVDLQHDNLAEGGAFDGTNPFSTQ